MKENKPIQAEKKQIRFNEVRDKIVLGLQKQELNVGEPVTLVDGFLNQPFNMELTNAIMIGGPTIPMVMLLGKNSGRIYLFALKAIVNLEELYESAK